MDASPGQETICRSRKRVTSMTTFILAGPVTITRKRTLSKEMSMPAGTLENVRQFLEHSLGPDSIDFTELIYKS